MSALRCQFPPFPFPPLNASILPFSQFSPQGYAHVSAPNGDTIEVDAFAQLPTLKIDTEEEAIKKKKEKKRRRCAGRCADESGKVVPWWEEWEMGEEQRGLSFDLVGGMSYRDRIHLAAEDFRLGRTWPAQGVRPIWDRFRLYIGLLSSMPVYCRAKAQKGNPTIPYDRDDAEEVEGEIPKAHQTHTPSQVSMSDATYALTSTVQDTLEQGFQPGKSTLLNFDDPTSTERVRLDAFITSISKGTKIFLSSYLRETGLIWTESNLFVAPMLLRFFFKFLKRTGVFWDSEERMGQEVENAIRIAEKAVVELPITARLGRAVPGKVESGFVGLWGRKCTGVSMTVTSGAGDSPSPETDETIRVDSVDTTTKDDDSWMDPPSPTLFQILGPTALPLAYITTIIETGTRRIREVVMPGSQSLEPVESALAAVQKEGENAARYGLEEALETGFAMIILEPWVSSEDEVEDTSEIGRPTVGCTVCDVHSSIGMESGDGARVASKGTKLPLAQCHHIHAHDPYTDVINVLVDLENVGLLKEGMGIYGTWVQLRRIEKMNSDGIVMGEGGNRRDLGYWYIEDLTAVFPSFHTEGDGVLGGYQEGEFGGEDGGDDLY